MEVLRTISLYSEAHNVKFIVIGGQAINYYGLSRQTGDLDIVVNASDRDWWSQTFARLKYSLGQNDQHFARYRHQELLGWPIDLMFVDPVTFDKLLRDALPATIGVADVRVISSRHLLLLKLHALRHYQEHRFAKDYNDVLWLIDLPNSCVSDSELRAMCDKYACQAVYERLIDDRAKNKAS